MSYSRRIACIVLAGMVALSFVGDQVRAQVSSNPYRAIYGWEKLPPGRKLGVIAGIYMDPDGKHLRTLRTIVCRSGLTRNGIFGSRIGRPNGQ